MHDIFYYFGEKLSASVVKVPAAILNPASSYMERKYTSGLALTMKMPT